MDVGLDSIWPKCEHSRRKNRIESSASSEMLSQQSAAHPSIAKNIGHKSASNPSLAKIRTLHSWHGSAQAPKAQGIYLLYHLVLLLPPDFQWNWCESTITKHLLFLYNWLLYYNSLASNPSTGKNPGVYRCSRFWSGANSRGFWSKTLVKMSN